MRLSLSLSFLFLLAIGSVSIAGEAFLKSVQSTPQKAVDLTEGSLDWAHWGLIKGETVVHRKREVAAQIGDLVSLGNRETHTFENNVTSFGWSDGKPTKSVSRTNAGVFIYGRGNGFKITVPADETPRTLRVYAGTWRASGKLEAVLSDNSAPSIAATTEPDPANEIKNVLHTINYQAGGPKQTLTVKWTNPGADGNVEFVAVTLSNPQDVKSVTISPKQSPNAAAFPLRTSDNGRYLIDKNDKPFFYHADTGWRTIMALTKPEAIQYFDDRQKRGFTALHLHIINKEKSGPKNRAGDHPFEKPDDMTRPNEAYWKHVDEVLLAARERGLLVALSSSWFGFNGSGWRKELTVESAQKYGTFLGERYAKFDNILWVHVGDNDPSDKSDAIRALVKGIREKAPQHLHTAHVDPEYASRSRFPDETWLDVNFAYTYKESYLHVANEWQRPGKQKPILLGETGYEGEKNGGKGYIVQGSDMRRQAWWALLSGAQGHAIGSGPIWCFNDNWIKSLDMQGTQSAGHILKFYQGLEWWRLTPDFKQELLTSGGGKSGTRDYVTSAKADDGSYAIFYLPNPRELTLNVRSLVPADASQKNPPESSNQPYYCWWFNPRDGHFYGSDGKRSSGSAAGIRPDQDRIAPPSHGAEDDWVLLISRNKLQFKPIGNDQKNAD